MIRRKPDSSDDEGEHDDQDPRHATRRIQDSTVPRIAPRKQGIARTGPATNAVSPDDFGDDFLGVDLLIGETMEEGKEEQRALEEHLAEADSIKATVNTSFDQLCRTKHKTQVPFELQNIYKQWLLQLLDNKGQPRFKEEWLPVGRGKFIKPGMSIPPPYGKEWELMVEDKGSQWQSKYMDYVAMQNLETAAHCTLEMIRASTALIYEDKSLALEKDEQRREQLVARRVEKITQYRFACKTNKKKRVKAQGALIDANLPEAPPSTSKALWQDNREEAQKWLSACLKEWNGLDDLGVFEHNFTRAELKARGVTTSPIPLTQALDYKFNKQGDIEKYKARYPLAGHPGNMQKGVHYKETFAPTPSQTSSRLLQALMVRYLLKRRTGDVAQAYCQSDLPKNELIAVRYPDGFKRYHPQTGEELFAMLRKSLYGHPAAGRYWDKHRNFKVLQWFNKDGYIARRSLREPSLVIIRRASDSRQWALLLTHTDDMDCVGTSDEIINDIFDRMRQEWEIRDTDPSFMLGIERNLEEKDGEMTVQMKMTAFIEGMMESFKEWKNDKLVHTPVKEDLFIHKKPKSQIDDRCEATGKEIIARGGQRLLGMLLWAARGCFPECLMGTSMLGRVMSQPTEEFWDNAVQMMNYMYQNRHRGIMFSSSGNKTPVALVDASNKPDPSDSKCQYGFVIMYMGGPLMAASKKLSHVGLSAAHNEYMAMHWCNRAVMWLRELLREIGFHDMVADATIVRGDNKAANTLCYEEIITSGNQFIITPYHFNKEVVAQNQVQVLYIRSAENLSDVLTKSVHRGVLRNLIDKLLGYTAFTDEDAEAHQEEKNQI